MRIAPILLACFALTALVVTAAPASADALWGSCRTAAQATQPIVIGVPIGVTKMCDQGERAEQAACATQPIVIGVPIGATKACSMVHDAESSLCAALPAGTTRC